MPLHSYPKRLSPNTWIAIAGGAVSLLAFGVLYDLFDSFGIALLPAALVLQGMTVVLIRSVYEPGEKPRLIGYCLGLAFVDSIILFGIVVQRLNDVPIP